MTQVATKPTVFCDFDGTITAVETFAGMMKTFAPQLCAELLPQLYEKKITLREGVRQILESIPSSQYEAAIAFGDDKPIRPGLPELIDFLDHHNIPFHVVSGGLKGMVERVLQRENLLQRVASVTAIEVDTRQDKIIVPPQRFEGDTELVAKVKVIQHHTDGETIAIGDSLTDVNMAFYVDRIFARDRLVKYLETENKPYLPWNDFRDIHHTLQQQWDT